MYTSAPTPGTRTEICWRCPGISESSLESQSCCCLSVAFFSQRDEQAALQETARARSGRQAPRMTPSKALLISRFRLHALQKAKRVERANGDQFEARHMCFAQRQLFEHFVSDGRIGNVDDERHARLSL